MVNGELIAARDANSDMTDAEFKAWALTATEKYAEGSKPLSALPQATQDAIDRVRKAYPETSDVIDWYFKQGASMSKPADAWGGQLSDADLAEANLEVSRLKLLRALSVRYNEAVVQVQKAAEIPASLTLTVEV